MAKRFALVIWWFGGILSGLLWAVGLWIVFQGGPDGGWANAIGWGIASSLVAAMCWAVAYVLGGSFWRPPKPGL